MDEIDLRDLGGEFTLLLEGPPHLIAVKTLAETLQGISSALIEINRLTEPDHELQVFIQGVDPGSIRIKFLTRTMLIGSVATLGFAAVPGAKDIARDLSVGILGSYLYDQMKPETPCKVDVREETVTVNGDGCAVTVHREVHEKMPLVRASAKVAKSVERVFRAVKKDQAVTSVGLAPKGKKRKAVISVPRERFEVVVTRVHGIASGIPPEALLANEHGEQPGTRLHRERVQLTVVKAVFRDRKRKWQFLWQGITLSAQIKDRSFFTQLESREIALRAGDALEAELLIEQHALPDVKAWMNKKYVVEKVYGVTIAATQTSLKF